MAVKSGVDGFIASVVGLPCFHDCGGGGRIASKSSDVKKMDTPRMNHSEMVVFVPSNY